MESKDEYLICVLGNFGIRQNARKKQGVGV